jgi:hypothetical protein
MIGPVVGHVPCALDHQRRIREARKERISRAVARAGRARKGVVDPPVAAGRAPAGEDVWRALRF